MNAYNPKLLLIELAFEDGSVRDDVFDQLERKAAESASGTTEDPPGFYFESLNKDLEPGAFDTIFLIGMTIGIFATSTPIAAWWLTQGGKETLRIDSETEQAKALLAAILAPPPSERPPPALPEVHEAGFIVAGKSDDEDR